MLDVAVYYLLHYLMWGLNKVAIDFALLPERKTLPKFPHWWIWPLLLVVFVIIGTTITFFISINHTISNNWFLGGIVFIPLLFWAVVSSFWLYCVQNLKRYTIGWNKLYDTQYSQMTELGQQPLYVIFNGLYTEQGYQDTARKITQEGAFLQSKEPLQGTQAILHAKLALEEPIKSSAIDIRVSYLLERFYKQIAAFLDAPWDKYPLHVRFCLDSPLDQKHLQALWKKQFSTYQFASIGFIDPAQSSQFIDTWIDDENEALLLVVSLHLFDFPQEKEGEAFSALLLASESLLSKPLVKQAITSQAIPLVSLHRPEIGQDLDKVIHNGVLWGAKEEAELNTIWYSHVEPELIPKIATTLNEQGTTLKNIYHLDNTIGHTGNCGYFTAVALAIEHAQNSEDKQLVVCQENEVSVSVVVKSKLLS